METLDLRPTNEGLKLIQHMEAQRRTVSDLEGQLNSARCHLSNAENDFIKWLVPKGAKAGEVFCVPVEEAFLEVRMIAQQSFPVELASGVEAGNHHTTVKPVIGWRDNRPPRNRSALGIHR